LSDEPSAVEPEQQSRAGRSEDAARRRATAWRRAAAALGVVALLVVAGSLLLGGDGSLIDGNHAGPGEFSFELKKVRVVPITRTPPADLQDEAEEAGVGVKATMDELYFRAFVDTGSWSDYTAAFDLFEEQAAARAEADTDVLTLGSTANEDYETLEPRPGALRIVVLADRKDAPVRAVAEVEFKADADLKDGTSTVLTSSGSFFLRREGEKWLIFAYRVDRDEQPSHTPSPTEEAP
jgi:hypothetical protein